MEGSGEGDLELELVWELSSVIKLGGRELSLAVSGSANVETFIPELFLDIPRLLRLP